MASLEIEFFVELEGTFDCGQNVEPGGGFNPLRLFLWSWRGLNPRPNRDILRFLHAYSRLVFSCCSKTWTTNYNLSFCRFHRQIETSPSTIPDFPAPLDQTLRNNSF